MTSKRLEDLPIRRTQQRLRRRLKEVPVLPSLVTLANVFLGFLAMAKIADALRTNSSMVKRAAVPPTTSNKRLPMHAAWFVSGV